MKLMISLIGDKIRRKWRDGIQFVLDPMPNSSDYEEDKMAFL
jgi:hypothetical protein